MLVAAHAPHKDPEWWSTFPERIRQVNAQGLPVVVLADANAHMGSFCSNSVGDVGVEQASLTWCAFSLALCDLCALPRGAGWFPPNNKNALRLPPLRKAILGEWETLPQLPSNWTTDEAEKALTDMEWNLTGVSIS